MLYYYFRRLKAMFSIPLYEGQVVTMSLKFTHLYDEKWAAFYGTASGRWQLRRIIFPQFLPEEGKEYEVKVVVTRTGRFVYKNEEFRVCRAELAEAATVMEVVLHQVYGAAEPTSAFGVALKNAAVDPNSFAGKLALAGFSKK